MCGLKFRTESRYSGMLGLRAISSIPRLKSKSSSKRACLHAGRPGQHTSPPYRMNPQKNFRSKVCFTANPDSDADVDADPDPGFGVDATLMLLLTLLLTRLLMTELELLWVPLVLLVLLIDRPCPPACICQSVECARAPPSPPISVRSRLG